MALYLGNGIAHTNTKAYVGDINGIARSIEQGYAGIDSIARHILGERIPNKTSLELTSWEDIQTITKLGLASTYWRVGAVSYAVSFCFVL